MSLDNPFSPQFVFGQQPGQLVKFPRFQQPIFEPPLPAFSSPLEEDPGLVVPVNNNTTNSLLQQWFDDEPPVGNLTGTAEEDYQIGLVVPSVVQNIVLAIKDDEAPTTLFGVYDEDYWHSSQPQAIPSTKSLWYDDEAALVTPLRIEEDYSIVGISRQYTNISLTLNDEGEFTRSGKIDEDYYPVIPPWLTKQIILQAWQTDPADITSITVDEDYWQVFVPRTLVRTPTILSDEGESTTVGLVDEDVWLNPVRQGTYQPNQPISEQGDSAWITVDEDYYGLTIPRLISNVPNAITDEAEITVAGKVDEDGWWVALPQSVITNRLFNPDEAESAFPVRGDEDYNWIGLVQGQYQVPKVFTDEGESTLVGNVDEDFWFTPVPSLWKQPSQPGTDQGDAVFITVEEDYYWFGFVQPLGRFVPTQVDEGEFTLVAKVDEDYWVTPVIVPYVQPRQPAIDQGDGTFVVSEEDYRWWYAPVTINKGPTPIVDEGEFALVANVDEDFWQVIVSQPGGIAKISLYDEGESTFPIRGDEDYYPVGLVQTQYRVPIAFTDEGEFVRVAVVDEDSWVVIAPQPNVPNKLYYNDEDSYASQLTPEEDFWSVLNVGTIPTVLPKPWQYDQNEQATGLFGVYDEDYWSGSRLQQFGLYVAMVYQDEEVRPIILAPDDDLWILTLNMPKALVITQQAFFDRTETLGYPILYITRMNDWLDLAALHRSVT